MHFRRLAGILGCVVLLGIAVALPLAAQEEMVLTLLTDEWMRQIYTQEFFADFYAEYPGVKVVTVPRPQDEYYSPAAYDAEGHFEGAERFVSYADVLWVNSFSLTTEDTRAGYFLDLTPLVNGDPSLNEGDFYPTVWQSVQWDQGIWALPVTASVSFMIYNPAAFDEAGVPYPNEAWTFDDFANAARALTQYDADGNVEVPGIMAWDLTGLYAAFTGERFFDDASVPAAPRLDTPELAAFLESYAALQEEGVINLPEGTGQINFDELPMAIEGGWRLTSSSMQGEEAVDWQASLLPGGTALLNVQGFAVSGGTEQPQLAYELAKYLTTRIELVVYTGDTIPARQSLVGIEPEESFIIQPDVPEDVQAFIEQAVAVAIPPSELRFGDYANMAYSNMLNEEEPMTAMAALQNAQADALQNLETADALRGSTNLMVAQPTPTPALAQGEISLRFRMSGAFSSLPNRDQWDQLIQEFVAADPEVGHVELITGFNPEPQEVDCYYEDFDGRIASMNLADPGILSLDPLVNADPAFDRNDLISRVLESVTRDNRIWAYPLAVFPEVLWYNSEIFAQANAVPPENGWTVEQFNDALLSLETIPEGKPAFVPNFSATYLMLLMAAYGAVPYDIRTNPPTLNISDPATIEGMRQVLDLAKADYIDYQELVTMGGGFYSGGDTMPIMPESLSTGNWRLMNRTQPEAAEDPYLLTTYPVGSQFTPMSYSVGAAYIDADAVNPEACYRWISALAERPDLHMGMPARRSQLSDPTLAAAYGDDLVAVYQQLDAMLQDPNAIVFGRYGNTSYQGGYIEQRGLHRVFDQYVLENGDLEADLAQLELDIAAYRECLAGLPEYTTLGEDATEEDYAEINRQYGTCAMIVDPDAAQMYGLTDE